MPRKLFIWSPRNCPDSPAAERASQSSPEKALRQVWPRYHTTSDSKPSGVANQNHVIRESSVAVRVILHVGHRDFSVPLDGDGDIHSPSVVSFCINQSGLDRDGIAGPAKAVAFPKASRTGTPSMRPAMLTPIPRTFGKG